MRVRPPNKSNLHFTSISFVFYVCMFAKHLQVQFVMGVTKNITTQKGFMDDDDDKDIFD